MGRIIRKWMSIGIFLLGGMLSLVQGMEEKERIEVVARIAPSVVAIFPPDGSGGGSGVVISEDGYVLTNFHVTQPCGAWMKCGLPGGEIFHAVLVGMDPVGDVALIKMYPPADWPEEKRKNWRWKPVTWGDSDQVRTGDSVLVLGNPFNFSTDFSPTVTAGIVSGTHRYQYPAGTLLEYADCIQVDASINPGNSGGPLFNAAGELIGINGRCSFEKRGRIHVGVGYAISANQIQHFLSHLRAGRVVDHATLGATVVGDELGRPIVETLLETSDASRQGLETGDRLVAFGNRRVNTPNEFKNVLGIYPKGWHVPIRVVRKTGVATLEEREFWVRLEGVHTEQELEKLLSEKFSPQKKEEGEIPQKILPPELLEQLEQFKDLLKMPPEVASCYEKRDGWANYWFHRQERERVWREGMEGTSLGWVTKPDAVLKGTLSSGTPWEMRFDAEKTTLKLPGNEIVWENTGDWTRLPQPGESGRILPGWTLWRELQRKEPKDFPQLHYWGLSPERFPEGEPDALYETLDGTIGGVGVRVYFSQAEANLPSRLVCLEMEDWDGHFPWRFHFLEGKEKSLLRVEIWRGDERIETFNVLEGLK